MGKGMNGVEVWARFMYLARRAVALVRGVNAPSPSSGIEADPEE